MDIKEILLNGGTVSFSYKENKEGWMQTANIHSFVYGGICDVVVEVPTLEIRGRKEFKHEEMDEAIALFKRLVFCEKNLCYKRHEALVNLKEENLDLDLEEDYELLESERNKILKSC